ncbi:MAG: YfhO family protein [Conexibacter sp.]
MRAPSTRAVAPARVHVYAALLLGAAVFAYLWPVLVGGKILSPNATLYGFPPWSASAPSGVHAYANAVLIDLPTAIYPWRFLVRELLREGTFPAWDPYVLGGIPLYQSPASGLFSLFNLPLWLLPLNYALGVSAALKLFAGAFGAYLLARQLRLSFLPGVLAGIAFAFSAINIVWLAHDSLPAVAVLLPWALWFVERLFERARPRDALGLAAAIAIAVGGGHPGMQIHVPAAVLVYAAVRGACWRGPRRRPLLLIGGGLAAGFLLMAFMLIPEARSAHDTVGVLGRRSGSLPGQKLPFSALKTVVFPDWWGRAGATEAPLDATNAAVRSAANYAERTFYGGTIALLLACVGLLARDGWRRKLPFVVLAVLGLAIALRAPGLHWLVTHLPAFKEVESQRLHFAYEFAVALLAAFGLQALLDAPRPPGRWFAVPLLALLGGAFALATARPLRGEVGHTVNHFLRGTDYASKAVLAMTSVVWFMLFALGVAALLLLARIRPRWRTGIAVAAVALAAVDAHHFVGHFQPMGPEAKVIPPVTPAVAYLRAHRDAGRIVGIDGAMPNDWPLVYGIRDVRGYDSPQPTRRMFALWRMISPGQESYAPFGVEGLGPTQVRALSVLGTRFVVAPPGDQLGRGAPPSLRTVYDGGDAVIFANAQATPRVLVPAKLHVTDGEAATRAAIGDLRFDPRTDVAVERDQPGVAALARAPLARGRATIVRERNASVTLRAQLDRRGLVLLDDHFTDGWSVRVDGRPAPALHVDDAMRGVIVPPGEHQVVWSYTVPGLRLGVAVSLVTLAGLLAAALWLRFGARAGALRGWRPYVRRQRARI